MAAITMVLVFLLAVVASALIVRLSPVKLPLPLVQIAIGAVLSFAIGFRVTLDPEIFFLLFIPPLLFLDGWRIPKGALFRDRLPIATLAVGLVVFTVVGAGFLIHWVIPAMPLAVAFAVAAILSPTDPVAVSAASAGTPIPPRLMHVLEGEALLNDASGLVCFRFAVAAAITGTFSLADAALSFVAVAAGGILVGMAVAWAITGALGWVTRRVGEEPSIHILVSLLVPFAAYLAAEHLGLSGILAAATAGISMHYSDLVGASLAATRMQRSAVWNTLQFALNGIIFVLLGEQLPRILGHVPNIGQKAGIAGDWSLLWHVLAIALALTALRFVWVWGSLTVAHLRPRRGKNPLPKPSLRLSTVTALAGVRGAVTLAGVLTLPTALPDGTPFPARDLAIFLAMGVILVSLVLASLTLPLVAGGLPRAPELPGFDDEEAARAAAAEAAIRRIEELRDRLAKDDKEADVQAEASAHLIGLYQRRLDYGREDDGAKRSRKLAAAEHRLWLAALATERDELRRLRLAREIDDEVHRKLVREVDLMEASLSGRHAP